MGYWMETQQDCSFILFSRQTNTIKRTTIYTNRCICILIVVRSMHGTQPFERDGLRRIRRLARSENTDTSLFNFSLGLAIYWKTIRTVCFITIEALSTLTAPVAEDNLISLYDRCPQDSLACKFDRGGRRTLHPHQALHDFFQSLQALYSGRHRCIYSSSHQDLISPAITNDIVIFTPVINFACWRETLCTVVWY